LQTESGWWAYSSLYSDKLEEKGKFNIPDSVLFKDGIIQQYIFTNRKGEVKRRYGAEEKVSLDCAFERFR